METDHAMKKILFLSLILHPAYAAWAQTNVISETTTNHEIGIHAEHFYYDGNARQLAYYDHVVVTNAQGRLACERLTINLPPKDMGDNNPTNAVAETNLDIIYVNYKGETNHLTADRGIYDYGVANGVTNETVTFTGHATNTGPNYVVTGEPLIWDNIKNKLTGSNVMMNAKVPTHPGDTNANHRIF